jgi:Mg-chelatase subunit ChlD
MQRLPRAKREEAMEVRRRLSVHWASQIAMQFCLLLGLAVCLHPVPAGAENSQHMSLDAILLMDDSGSMRKTDPLKLRFSALSLLTRLLRRDDAVGVVKFDDTAKVMLPLHPMHSDENRRALDQTYARFASRGMYTNIYAGLQTALEEMQRRRRADATSVVILVSDGLMDVNPASGMSNAEAIGRLRRALLPAYQRAQVKIITLALSPEADRALLQDIATTAGGYYFEAPDAQALSQALFQIFDSLKAPDMIPVRGQRVTIDASIKEATFFIQLDTAKEDVALIRPDGDKVTGNSQEPTTKWFVGIDYVLCTIQRPQAGEWRIQTTSGRPIKVVVITDVWLDVALVPAQVVSGQEVRIAARLMGTDHLGPAALSLGELNFMAEVLTPGAGESTTSRMSNPESQRSEQALGQWHSALYTAPGLAGEYQGRVLATAPTFSREKSFTLLVSPPHGTTPPIPSPLTTPPASSPAGGLTDAAIEEVASSPGEEMRSGEPFSKAAPDSLSASLSRVFRILAIAHAALLMVAGGVFVGRRLLVGAWWNQRASTSPPSSEEEGEQEEKGHE